MALHEGHRIEAGIGVVAGVEADLQDALVDLIQKRSSSGSKSMKPPAWA
jgi:Ni,Fe-hydrogenase III large subunit